MNNITSCRSYERYAYQSKPKPRRTLGFTLIEVLVVVAIFAIMGAVAAPAVGAVIESVKVSNASNIFLSNLYLARGEAIKRNSRVVLCKSANGNSCTESGGWEQGWIVFNDTNDNSVRDADEVRISRELPLAANLRLSGNLTVARYISFSPMGGTKLVGGAFQSGTLTLCRKSLQVTEARQIVLNAAGRPRVQKVTVGSCN